jgi:hypothetical protein
MRFLYLKFFQTICPSQYSKFHIIKNKVLLYELKYFSLRNTDRSLTSSFWDPNSFFSTVRLFKDESK